jgi:hypothetical protein
MIEETNAEQGDKNIRRLRMKVTKRWLENRDACSEAVDAFCSQKERELIPLLRKMIRADKLDWANWLIVRKMNRRQLVRYAVYAAEQVIDNYEKEYPDDDRPRKAIQAAKRYIKNPTAQNKLAARSAAADAWSSARSAESAESAARSAESAAWSAARSAASAAWSAAWSAESAGRAVARSVAWSAESAAISIAWSAESTELKKVLRYGVKLIKWY